MPTTRAIRLWFRALLRRGATENDLDREMRVHLEMEIEQNVRNGMAPDEARRQALIAFGGVGRHKESVRDERGVRWLDDAAQDVRYAVRSLRHTIGFTTVAVLTLALGIGANTAIFTVVHRLLLDPLPYPDGNRIVELRTDNGSPDAATLRLWRARAHSLTGIAAVSVDAVAVESGEEQDTVHATITPNYLQLLGVEPALGRVFTPEEALPGGPAVAMIGYGLWQRGYGGRADALGKTIQVSDAAHPAYTIIGVTPRGMVLPISHESSFRSVRLREAEPGIYLPVSLDAMGANDGADAYARLRAGVSAEQASQELAAIVDSLPGPDQKRIHPRAMRAQDYLAPRETRTIQVLFVAVGVLLLIACANVANLLMSRAWTRRREFAVRVALGAGRGRLARQVLTESVLLALAGGLLGMGVAWETLRIVIALRPPALGNLAGVHIESTVLLWTAVISIATGILFGCAPTLLVTGRSVGDVLRNETRGGSGGVASRRVRATLIVLEIAMSLVLLVGAGLLTRSFAALQRTSLGFDPHGLASVDLLFNLGRRPTEPLEAREARASAVRQNIIDHLRAVSGVTDVAVGTLPGDGYGIGSRPTLGASHSAPVFQTEADSTGHTRDFFGASSATFVSPNYFRMARMSFVEGSEPDPASWVHVAANTPQTPEEVVVNRALARYLWPDGGAVGSRMHSGGAPSNTTYLVVGVVDDVHMPGPRAAVRAFEIYIPAMRVATTFLVRTVASPSDLTSALRKAVAGADPSVVYFRGITIGDRYLDDSLAPTRFAMALLAAFAIIALLLSAIGLYGVIAYSVNQRTREIGVRVALGAESSAVAALVIGDGFRLALGGIVLGSAAAVVATRALSSMLYGVSPDDPGTFVAVAVLVALIALLASYAPMRRALRIQPTDALRAD
jgi:predicted permease